MSRRAKATVAGVLVALAALYAVYGLALFQLLRLVLAEA